MISIAEIGRLGMLQKKKSVYKKARRPVRFFAAMLAVFLICGAMMLGASACNGNPPTPVTTDKPPRSSVVPEELERFEAYVTGPLDTVTTIIILAADKNEFEEYRLFIEQELWRYHQLFDIYEDYAGVTNIKAINDGAGNAVSCPNEILDLIEFGFECWEKSDGRINIAMGTVLKLWHDARTLSNADATRAYIPDQKALEDASRHTSIDRVTVDREKGTVTLSDPAMSLDVGAIAKGYTVEKIADALVERGIYACALNAGGNVRVIGHNIIKGIPWRIAIKNPIENPDKPNVAIVEVEDRSVVTSGNEERYFMYDGKRYSHIIDPATNFPAEYHDSVSIIGEDSGVSDLLSTTLMMMTEEDGRELLLNFPGYEALWVRGSALTMTEGFAEYVAWP